MSLVCPVCLGPLSPRSGRVTCRTCALHYGLRDGVYALGPSFALNGAANGHAHPFGARMARLLAESTTLGWQEARRRFTHEVTSGALAAPPASRLGRMRAKLTGATWEDVLQDLGDPTRAGWKFLLDLASDSRVLFLGPSWGAVPLSLARSAAHVVVLDGARERLRVVRQQAWSAGLENVTVARVLDPLRLPLANGSVDVAVVPGIAEWFAAVAGARPQPASSGIELLLELRRVLAPGGQAYLGIANRLGVTRLLGVPQSRTTYSPQGIRRAAAESGFTACRLFAPVPFRHKFNQILDLDRPDRMNFCADPYRTRGRGLRAMVRAWERVNRRGAIEQRACLWLPGFHAVLSTAPAVPSFAERLLDELASAGRIPAGARQLCRYFVRPRGVVVLAAGAPGREDAMVRLPLDAQAETGCRRHHDAITLVGADTRIPHALRRLFPLPLAEGTFAGQAFFAESAVPGESGRMYYARPARRYDRAIASAAEAVCGLRRATEAPVRIDAAEFARLCGDWLGELRGFVRGEGLGALDVIEAWLGRTLIGTTLPLGWQHGDFDLANLLYGPDDRVTGILDFEAFEPRGLPLIDLLLLLARRVIRRQGMAFGDVFVGAILNGALAPLEAELFAREMAIVGADEQVRKAIALCSWLNHLKLRRDSWLVRSPSWLDANLHSVLEIVRSVL